MWTICGRIVPLTSDTRVAPTGEAAFTGRMRVDEATGGIIAFVMGWASLSGSRSVLRGLSLVAASGKPV